MNERSRMANSSVPSSRFGGMQSASANLQSWREEAMNGSSEALVHSDHTHRSVDDEDHGDFYDKEENLKKHLVSVKEESFSNDYTYSDYAENENFVYDGGNSLQSIGINETEEERIAREKKAELEQAYWTMMPKLFDMWDLDGFGELDKDEIMIGVQSFCEKNGFDFDSEQAMEVFAEVDDNNDGELDRREFSAFVDRFVKATGIPLDEMARFVVEQKKEKMQQEKRVLLEESYWKMIPRLFDYWDLDGMGELDREEILAGVQEFCETHGFEFDNEQALEIFAKVDDNHDGILDRREFTFFVNDFASSTGITLEQMACSVAKQLYETNEEDNAPPELTDEEKAMLEKKLKQEKHIHLEQAYWTLVPRLFDRWNTDGVGELSKDEILAGVQMFCVNNEYEFDSERALALFEEVDDNNDGELDRREFSFFIDRFAKVSGIPWEEMAVTVGQQLYDNQVGEDSRTEYTEEERKRLEEAWTMMPRLFDIWDADESGELDKDEVLLGVQEFCDVHGFDFDSRRTLALFAEVDYNNDCVLDRREFSVFVARFAEIMEIPLDEMAFSVAEQLADIAMTNDAADQQIVSKQSSGWDILRPMISSRSATKSAKWNELKEVSEKLYASEPSVWEKAKLLSMKSYRASANTADKENKSAATSDMWFSLSKSVVENKRTEENAGYWVTNSAPNKGAIVDSSKIDNPKKSSGGGLFATLDAIRRKGEQVTHGKKNSPPEKLEVDPAAESEEDPAGNKVFFL